MLELRDTVGSDADRSSSQQNRGRGAGYVPIVT
jgi:hypothetical protein